MIGTILDIFRSHTHTHNMSFSRRRMAPAAQIPRSTTRPHTIGRSKDGGPIMRTRLILAEGANHAQINPPSTHSRCVHLECDEVEVGPRGTSGSATPACQQTSVGMHQHARWRCPRLPQAACRWCASCRRDIAVAADGQALVAMIRPRRP